MSRKVRRDVVLRRLNVARDLVADKNTWTKDVYAHDKDGNEISPP